jgi:hypothetical protein
MITSISAPNKASEDVKSGGQTYPSGQGHHMKIAAKKCKYFIFIKLLIISLFFSLKGLNKN